MQCQDLHMNLSKIYLFIRILNERAFIITYATHNQTMPCAYFKKQTVKLTPLEWQWGTIHKVVKYLTTTLHKI